MWRCLILYFSMVPPSFWMKMTIWVISIIVLNLISSAILRKVLRVEKRKFFSYNFVNEIHKKGEWIIRISFIIIYTSIAVYSLVNPFKPFLIYAAIAFGILLSGYRAIIEKKYAENPKDYIFTLSETGFAFMIIFVMTLLVFPESLSYFGFT